MALPFLEGMAPLSALAQSISAKDRPLRLAFVFIPNGLTGEILEGCPPPVDRPLPAQFFNRGRYLDAALEMLFNLEPQVRQAG